MNKMISHPTFAPLELEDHFLDFLSTHGLAGLRRKGSHIHVARAVLLITSVLRVLIVVLLVVVPVLTTFFKHSSQEKKS